MGLHYRSKISGTGSFLPERRLSNLELEKLVDTTDEWIRERTGIESRHIAAAGEATSDLAFEASKRALAAAGISAGDLDGILIATVTPDHSLPNTACLLQARLGCRPILALDLSAACSGFLYALTIAEHLIRAGTARHILVVGAETLSRIINYQDRQTCILFGDGAGAAVLSRAEDSETSEIHASTLAADGSNAKLLAVPAGGSRKPFSAEVLENREHFVHMQGREIFKAAVTTLKTVSNRTLEACGKTVSDVDWFFIHQANRRIVESLAGQMGLAEGKVPCNVDRVGNTSSASIPILLDESIRSGKVKRGDTLLLAAFGAGLTSGAVVLKY